jgi:hypothetical protein
MRRLILEEPWSAAALWSRRLTLFALTVGVMSVGLARSGVVDVTAILAVFGAADEAAAQGHFTHVTVNRASGRPVAMPALLRAAAEGLMAVQREGV